MIRFIAVRLVQLIPVGFGITLIVFMLLRLVPGDPAEVMLGVRATPEMIAQVHDRLGLDEPLHVQYLLFLSRALQGDLGTSYFYGQPAIDLVLQRLWPELILIAYVVLLTILIGVPLGIVAALRRETLADNAIRGLMVVGLSLPVYWVGLIFLLVFGVWLRIVPVGGYGDSPGGYLHSLFLPALTIALAMAPLVIRALRASLIEVLAADYIDMARSKGLPWHIVFVRHALRSALIPTVTVLGVNVGYLVGGMVITEAVFAIPGLGLLMITAISTRDYPAVQATTLVFAVFVVLVNLMADILVALLDPRARAALRA